MTQSDTHDFIVKPLVWILFSHINVTNRQRKLHEGYTGPPHTTKATLFFNMIYSMS